ncbi:MAG: hypothetical protein HC860_14110 [Alkalinema sp. RU_4_3]|nr:hypothetical protein [Alkalinema sp. RU_4_3]
MFPPLHQSKIFLASVFLCIPSSATVNLEILWFSKRMQQDQTFELPISVDWQLAIAA